MHNKIRTSRAVKQRVATNDALVRIVESKCDSCGQLTHTVLMSQGVKIRVELMAERSRLQSVTLVSSNLLLLHTQWHVSSGGLRWPRAP